MTDLSRRFCLNALVAVAAMVTGTAALAQPAGNYPDKPIRLIVSSAAGGGADTVARLMAKKIGEALKQPVVVENRPGASGVVAANAVLGAPADGYTLLLGFTTMAQVPATTQIPLSYNPEKDFIPVSLIAKSWNVLFVNRKTNAKTIQELVAGMKANPRQYSYGSYGNGSTGHFMGALFAQQTKTEPSHVPYKGAAPMMTDLLAGVVSFAFPDIGSALPHIKSDRVQALAVTSSKRLTSLPDVPTMAELGIKGFDFGGWFGLFAPKGTPQAIVDVLSAQSMAAVKDREVQAKLVSMDLDPVGSNSKEFATFFHADMAKWAKIAKDANIKAE
ncbi:MAG TPA: tripartite tricarboxylate transporter substrate binding protein [Burkholderiaceae bacterium]|jgi:tripartite-type tricarboxylate transporter receptor subunit TctC|nr:tripartite tricarboxylate transporter substrate binding protein [Burkholderiaceae bacterium]